MRLQDSGGPLGELAVFHNGAPISAPTADQDSAYNLRNRLAATHPGCEVLAVCPAHSDRAAVDCLTCWPLDDGSPP